MVLQRALSDTNALAMSEATMDKSAFQKSAAGIPNSPAQRMRRYRRRRRYRRPSVRIEVDQAEIDGLIKQRYLDDAQRDDVAAIGEAVTAFISDALVLGP
jgi:hypothetical protein